MFSIILAEAALEQIPKEILKHNSVINYALKVKSKPQFTLLDISYHYNAMRDSKLPDLLKRGRPDITHFGLLEVTSSPLFRKRNLVKLYIHTINNDVIFVDNDIRPPKTYSRFEGLMMKLFEEKKIIYNMKDTGKEKILLEIKKDIKFVDLVKKIIKPKLVIGLSSQGEIRQISDILDENRCNKDNEYAFVIGGFQRGQFSKEVEECFDKLFSISNYSLESHTVLARLVYEFEKYVEKVDDI